MLFNMQQSILQIDAIKLANKQQEEENLAVEKIIVGPLDFD